MLVYGKANSYSRSNYIVVAGRLISLKIKDVIYIEKVGNYEVLHCVNQDSEVKIRCSLKRLEEQLPNSFFRSHASFLINLNYLKSINKLEDMRSFEVELNDNSYALMTPEKYKKLYDSLSLERAGSYTLY